MTPEVKGLRQEDPWVSLATQCSYISKFQANEGSCLNKVEAGSGAEWVELSDAKPADLSSVCRTHALVRDNYCLSYAVL